MLRALLIIGLVIAVLVGGLFTLLSTRSLGTPSDEVLERAKKRARELGAADKDRN